MEPFLDDLCGFRFGSDQQLEVLAVVDKVGYTKTYSVRCDICAKDPELFGNGTFKSYRTSIKNNYPPCGCGGRPLWSEDQFKVICKREALKRGFTLEGFFGEYKGNKTKLDLSCELHGKWNSTDINHFLNGRGCPGCKAVTCAESATGNTHSRMDDDLMIQSFMATGSFHPNTVFTRCDPKTSGRRASDWQVECPDCESTVIARSCNIKLGYKPCNCGSGKQKYSYINVILDEEDIIAVKYGIAINPEDRLKKQAWKSIYSIKNFGVWEFSDYQSCRDAETYCKRTFPQSLSREEMPDGFSETTFPYNIDEIIRIYKEHGGVQINANQ
jgi:hypothetical protein